MCAELILRISWRKNYKLQPMLQFKVPRYSKQCRILIFYTSLKQESYDCIQHTSPITFSTSQTFGNIFNSKFPPLFFFLSAKTMKRYLIAEHLLALSLLLCGPARAKWSQLGDHWSSQSNSPYRAFFFGGGGVQAHCPADKQMIVPRSSAGSGWCVATGCWRFIFCINHQQCHQQSPQNTIAPPPCSVVGATHEGTICSNQSPNF